MADKIIVQVNRYQPRVNGMEHRVHVSKVSCICEYDHPLAALAQGAPTDIDNRIADFVVPQIPDGATNQIGLGALSDAVGYKLAQKKNLSVHTEMFTDSMVELVKKGVINGKMVAGFGLGSEALYNFIGEGKVELKPVRITNDPREIAKIDNIMSVNVTLMVDLTGQACSESIGFLQYSSTGGQADFVRGAAWAKGGKSFLCLPSTVKMKDGKVISSITAAFPPGAVVTTTRSDIMYVVTEYGIADLFCKPIKERVKALIAIAHPDFRDQLGREAVDLGLTGT
jgi:acyl-CoA hydrolase